VREIVKGSLNRHKKGTIDLDRYVDKNVVITGGTAGIGLATARRLVAGGARVLVTGRNADALQDARNALAERAIAVRSDTASPADIDELARRARTEFDALDLVFVNAGITRWIPFEDVDQHTYDEIFDVNTKGAHFTVQKLAPLLRPGGAVVLTTSVTDILGFPLTSVSRPAKPQCAR
jgi:NAD(P)-dependent dehydrogenase (short-subunit alcohol dehydrogenase family)